MNATNTNCCFIVDDFNSVKKKMLHWANQYSIFCFLDNHNYQVSPHSVECLLAAGVKRKFKAQAGNAINGLQKFIEEKPAWLFGHLSYDLKNEMEKLNSFHKDFLAFPDCFFFEPEIIISLNEKELRIEGAANADKTYSQLMAIDISAETNKHVHEFELRQRFTKAEYLQAVGNLKAHILRGDCYEINFCQEFFAEHAEIDPLNVYSKLSALSPNPFSALYKLDDKYLICASPERFLRKEGNKILSQPIKGTSTRYRQDKNLDEQSRHKLFTSEKDRSENVMVVDLVRNDLSRVCEEGTVRVDELFGIYSFPQVHQMISTVSGELKKDVSFAGIIKATFPMGSMTGAPKKSVMELIEQQERSRRGIFSGALGYISPENNFDFNVVIRSIMYNASSKYLSFMAGSGITFYSDAEQEYEECMIKAEAMKGALME